MAQGASLCQYTCAGVTVDLRLPLDISFSPHLPHHLRLPLPHHLNLCPHFISSTFPSPPNSKPESAPNSSVRLAPRLMTSKWPGSILLGAHKLRARRTVCKSVLFFKDINCWRTIRGLFWLKEPWSPRFGTLPTGQKLLKNDSEHTYEAQAALDKFFNTEHYMKKHDPSLPVGGRFYGWGLATMTGKRTQAQTTASKSGMTLTNREV
jgi:hypothetical protein